jgi:F-box domain
MSPQLLDLSVELLIQILAHLSLRNIGACALTSRRLHSVISNSQYLRYLVRTEKAGVNDPFLTVLSLPERMAVLEKWERTWHVPDLRQPASQCVVPSNISVSIIRYEIHGGYLVARRRYPVDDRPVGYSYIYLHDAVKRGSVTWHDVDLLQPMSVVSYCFNVEEYNLAVMLVLCGSILSTIPPAQLTFSGAAILKKTLNPMGPFWCWIFMKARRTLSPPIQLYRCSLKEALSAPMTHMTYTCK